MKLVIAEKPSVGAAIAAVMGANEKRSGYFEGGGYLVSWCIGHLISLADAATYNEQFRKWKYDDLPISLSLSLVDKCPLDMVDICPPLSAAGLFVPAKPAAPCACAPPR